MKTVSPLFLEGAPVLAGSAVALLGVPFDGTSSYRPGSRFAPRSIRQASLSLESYSPLLDLDLEDCSFADLGDLDVPVSCWDAVDQALEEAVTEVLEAGSAPLLLGGEHLVTLPAVRACRRRYADLAVLQLDAHLDLRQEYQGLALSHATVMRRVCDLLGADALCQWGVRSGTREEWDWAREQGTVAGSLEEVRGRLGGRPVYLTVDLDVLDPSVLPETGTPEPGGATFRELQELLHSLRRIRLVGGDVVELSPAGEVGGASAAAAAKVVRELLLLLEEARG